MLKTIFILFSFHFSSKQVQLPHKSVLFVDLLKFSYKNSWILHSFFLCHLFYVNDFLIFTFRTKCTFIWNSSWLWKGNWVGCRWAWECWYVLKKILSCFCNFMPVLIYTSFDLSLPQGFLSCEHSPLRWLLMETHLQFIFRTAVMKNMLQHWLSVWSYAFCVKLMFLKQNIYLLDLHTKGL